MSVLWLFGGMIACGMIALMSAFWYRRHRHRRADLGTVSHQWIAEQRLSAPSDRHAG
jgi:hypothetical protein